LYKYHTVNQNYDAKNIQKNLFSERLTYDHEQQ